MNRTSNLVLIRARMSSGWNAKAQRAMNLGWFAARHNSLRLCIRWRSTAIFMVAFGLFAGGITLLWPDDRPASISVEFSRFETTTLRTNMPLGILVISNTCSRNLFCHGVGASYEQQITQVLSPEGWVDTHCWLSPGAGWFRLSPGETREVPVLVETNLPWRIKFRVRRSEAADIFPWYVRRYLPDTVSANAGFREIWSPAVPAHAKP